MGDSRAFIGLWAEGMYPAWFEQGLPVVLRTGLEAAGAKSVGVSHTQPLGEGLLAFRHQYEVHWK